MSYWAQQGIPGTIVHVIDGCTYFVDLDLGWHIHHMATIRAVGFVCQPHPLDGWLEARKAAQHLLPFGAGVLVQSLQVFRDFTEAEIDYAAWWHPLSEEGSLRTAMIASGHATRPPSSRRV
jgi:hypothetical protein